MRLLPDCFDHATDLHCRLARLSVSVAQKLNGTRIQTLQRTFLGQTADVDIYSVPCNTVSYVGLGLTFVGSSSSAPLVMNAADNISERETIGGTTTCYGSFFGIDLLYNGVPASILGRAFPPLHFSLRSRTEL